jgi:hypothetical protein
MIDTRSLPAPVAWRLFEDVELHRELADLAFERGDPASAPRVRST